MKKTAIILFPALAALILCGCGKRGGDSTSNSSIVTTSSPSSSSSSTSATGPKPADQHVTGISISPTKPFMAQIGDVRKFNVSHEGSPTDQTEKSVTWSLSDKNIASLELIETTGGYFYNAQVTFLKEGKVTITVTSDYNTKLTKSVDVTVVSQSEYNYLWNCAEGDKTKFTKIDPNQPTPQLIEDDVTLNGLTWHVKRYEATKDAYGSQNIQFGYGDKEGQIDFTLVNTKEVESIQVGCSSKAETIGIDPETGREIQADYGSSKLTIKVGDETYLSPTNTAKGTTPEALSTPSRSSYSSGNITLSFSASVGYIAIQNIFIKYTHYLDSLSVNTDNCKTTFEVNDKFDYGGLIAKATYKNDVKEYDVSSSVIVTPPDLSTTGNNKVVDVSFTDSGKTVSTSYLIDVVAPRTVESVSIIGSPNVTKYFVGDAMSYDGLTVVVNFTNASSEVLLIPTQNQGDFTDVNVPAIASISMNDAWSISLTYRGFDASKDFASGTYSVITGSITFDMLDYTLSGYSTYDDFQDKSGLVNMHVAANSEPEKTEKTGGYPVVYGSSIEFTTLDSNVCFKKIEFVFAPYITGSTPKTETGIISVSESIFGSKPFTKNLGSVEFLSSDTKCKEISSEQLSKGSNAIEISFPSSKHFGLVSFSFELTRQEHAIPESISYTGELVKKVYNFGEKFSSKGLAFKVIFENDYSPETISDPDSNIVWNELKSGDTSVTGTFLGLNVTVTGITVNEYVGNTYSRINETLQDFSGTYLITSVADSSIWNGSLKTASEMKGENSVDNSYDVKFDVGNQSLTADYVADNATFTITKQESGNYLITSASGFYCGLTASGGLQVVSSKPREVKISIDGSGNAIISNQDIEGTTTVKQIGISSSSGKFTTYAAGSSSDQLIQLFKQD